MRFLRLMAWTGAALAICAAAGGLAACSSRSESAPADEFKDKKGNILRTVEAQSGTFRLSVTATGKVEALREVKVSSKASGEILEMPYETGTAVKKGELLVRLDPDDEERNVRKTEASLRSAEASEAKARNELELAKSDRKRILTNGDSALELARARVEELRSRHARQVQLFEKKLVSEQDLEASAVAFKEAESTLTQAEATLEDAKNSGARISAREQDVELAAVQVANARIALEEAQERLAETEVRSPMDGVVTTRDVEPGFVISSAISNIGGGTLLMTVSDLSRLFIVAQVDEADIGGVRLDELAEVRVDAYPGKVFPGRVHHISPVGVELNSVVSFDVKIEVTGDGLKYLHPGMTADVTITTGVSENAVWIQSDAIEETPEGLVVRAPGENGETKDLPVELGLTDGIQTQIVKGLSAGQRVIVPDAEGASGMQRRGRRRS